MDASQSQAVSRAARANNSQMAPDQLLPYHSRSSGGILLQDFDDHLANRELLMRSMRRRGHAVKDHCSSFNIVGKFAQGCYGLGIVESESVLPRSISTLRCVDAGPASANHIFLPLTRKKNVLPDRSLLKKFPYTLLTPLTRKSRHSFRISETADYRPVIKTRPLAIVILLFSMRYQYLAG